MNKDSVHTAGASPGPSSIRQRLLRAFFFLALLPIVSALIVWSSRPSVEAPLKMATDRNTVFTDTVVTLTEQIVLLRARLDEQPHYEADLESWSRAVNSDIERIADTARELDRLGDQATPDTNRFTALAAVLRSASEALGTSQRLSLERDQQIESLLAAVTDATDKVATVVSSFDTAANGRADLAARVGVEVRFATDNIGVILNALRDATLKRAVDAVRIDYLSMTREIVLQVSLLDDSQLTQTLAEPLRIMYDAGVDEAGLFGVALERIRAGRERQDATQAMSLAIAEINNLLAQEVQRNVRATREVLTAASGAFSRMHRNVLIVGVLGILVAIAFIYRYVTQNLLRRLAKLSEATARLSEGDLTVSIEQGGSDELALISEALEVFRENAVRLSESELKLQRRTGELEQVNAELDKFAYVASHDLRAPLRAIENLSSFLKEDLGDTIPAQSRDHLSLMSRRIQRLDTLLTSLLEYSRVGRVGLDVEPVDAGKLIKDIGDSILMPGFTLDVDGTVPTVFAHSAPLSQVIRNLIDNAQKHHDWDSGQINVQVALHGSELRLCVVDDGPGIATEFHDRVFGMFQTLRSRDEVEGSGMGLAILHKLAETFGGSITIDSDPKTARGTRFDVA
ncbi:MAG: ATP-binding protein, partial [Pseudomonadota bacterium]